MSLKSQQDSQLNHTLFHSISLIYCHPEDMIKTTSSDTFHDTAIIFNNFCYSLLFLFGGQGPAPAAASPAASAGGPRA